MMLTHVRALKPKRNTVIANLELHSLERVSATVEQFDF